MSSKQLLTVQSVVKYYMKSVIHVHKFLHTVPKTVTKNNSSVFLHRLGFLILVPASELFAVSDGNCSAFHV